MDDPNQTAPTAQEIARTARDLTAQAITVLHTKPAQWPADPVAGALRDALTHVTLAIACCERAMYGG